LIGKVRIAGIKLRTQIPGPTRFLFASQAGTSKYVGDMQFGQSFAPVLGRGQLRNGTACLYEYKQGETRGDLTVKGGNGKYSRSGPSVKIWRDVNIRTYSRTMRLLQHHAPEKPQNMEYFV
jgi:hypothetical protein